MSLRRGEGCAAGPAGFSVPRSWLRGRLRGDTPPALPVAVAEAGNIRAPRIARQSAPLPMLPWCLWGREEVRLEGEAEYMERRAKKGMSEDG